MVEKITPIKVWHEVDRSTFASQIQAKQEPAVIKSLVGDWPAVKAGKQSAAALCQYLQPMIKQQATEVLVGPPAMQGKFAYTADLTAFNFTKKNQQLNIILDTLLSLENQAVSPYIAVQGLSVEERLPAFHQQHKLPLLDDSITPRMWIGNRVTTVAHYDHQDNIACVVAGKRKFTLFPPEQVANLYIGPLLATPAGPPISMVDLSSPDFQKYPRYKRALAAAQEAVLEPGDAIFIPYLWWHHVESLAKFNLLVNYWWGKTYEADSTPYQCLLHSMLTIPDLPEHQRKIWRAFFDHYVFQLNGKPADHLPEHVEDIISQLPESRRNNIKQMLAKALQSKQ
jgi:hypothetical protein